MMPLLVKKMWTMLVRLVIEAGRDLPQLFSIKVVPSSSVIVRWSKAQVEWDSILKVVNSMEIIICFPTSIVSCFLTLLG